MIIWSNSEWLYLFSSFICSSQVVYYNPTPGVVYSNLPQDDSSSTSSPINLRHSISYLAYPRPVTMLTPAPREPTMQIAHLRQLLNRCIPCPPVAPLKSLVFPVSGGSLRWEIIHLRETHDWIVWIDVYWTAIESKSLTLTSSTYELKGSCITNQ